MKAASFQVPRATDPKGGEGAFFLRGVIPSRKGTPRAPWGCPGRKEAHTDPPVSFAISNPRGPIDPFVFHNQKKIFVKDPFQMMVPYLRSHGRSEELFKATTRFKNCSLFSTLSPPLRNKDTLGLDFPQSKRNSLAPYGSWEGYQAGERGPFP